jgi:hypothetical protein
VSVPRVAVADAICIVRFVSVLLIVHVMSWAPSEHTACPDANGRCAHAGIADTATKTQAKVATPAAMTVRRQTDEANRRRAMTRRNITVSPRR